MAKLGPMNLTLNGRNIGCVLEPMSGSMRIGEEITFTVRMRRKWWAPFAIAWALAGAVPLWVRPYAFVTTLVKVAASDFGRST